MKRKILRVLLVEDSELDAELIVRNLQRAGYDPFSERVETRDTLTRALEGGPWDLVLCDNAMPKFSGREAFDLIKKMKPELPLIFVSGLKREPRPGHEYLGQAAGNLEKGESEALIALVGRILSGEKPPAAGSSVESLPRSGTNQGRPRILIVDDQPENLLALEAALSGVDADFVHAGSGQEALARLLDGDYALILLDVRMPGMTGVETAEMFRKRARTRWVPVILMTAALDDPSEVARGYAAGCVDYLGKPFVPEVLRAKVDVFLELWKKTMQLERQASQLRAANEGLEGFTGSAAHDLRAPLRAIEGFSRILSEDYSGKLLDESGLVFLEKIRQAAGRMDALIRDLLAFAHLNRQLPRPGPVDLNDVMEGIFPSLAAEIKLSGGQVTVERPLGTVVAQASVLQQALENLISNALKFAKPAQAPEVRIRSEAKPGGRRRLWVEDRGIGIAKGEEEKLFQPFSRLDSASAYTGTGLGLAIAKRAIERMGGTIGVESELGKGSRFFIELPGGRPGE